MQELVELRGVDAHKRLIAGDEPLLDHVDRDAQGRRSRTLDVYKRQLQSARRLLGLGDNRDVQVRQAVIAGKLDALGAVSYTHLDVYKRQEKCYSVLFLIYRKACNRNLNADRKASDLTRKRGFRITHGVDCY